MSIPTKKVGVVVVNLFTLNCPHCSAEQDTLSLSCGQCDQLLSNLLTLDPFHLLAIDPHTIIDRKALKQHYIKAQQSTHPDACIAHPEKLILATQVSSHINTAFQKLSCPFQRSLCFLKHHGVTTELPKTQPDDLLEELLTLRENMLTINDESTLHDMLSELNLRVYKLLESIAAAISKNDTSTALHNTAQISYLLRIKKDAKKIKTHDSW